MVSSLRVNSGIKDKKHTHVNVLQVVVHVPLDVNIFHPY